MRNVSKDYLSPVEVPVEIAREHSNEVAGMKDPAKPEQDDDLTLARMPQDTVASKLQSNFTTGLTSAQAQEKLATDGPNELEQPPIPGFIKLFGLQLLNFVIILLMVAAVASLVVAATGTKNEDPLSYTTGIAIFILIIVNAGIAAKTEAQANGALDALKKMSQAAVMVLRDGKEVKCACPELVRGDIVNLGVGDIVPADCRLVDSADFKVNEMPLTGEPEDVGKTHKVKELKPGETPKLVPDTMAFSGCLVTNGKAKCIITSTGMGTRIGKIAQMLQGESGGRKCMGLCPDTSAGQTPLQANVEKLGARIGILAVLICVFVWIIGVVMKTVPPDYDPSVDDEMVSSIIYMILISVTLAVAAIPEGIPLCVTISLSLGCSQMVDYNVLVKKLAAVETLGSASVICTDKTGTLTEGKMTMVQMWTGDKYYAVTGKGFNPDDGQVLEKGSSPPIDSKSDRNVRSTLFAGLCCCNTTLEKKENGVWEPQGNSSEAPIVVAAQKIGFREDVTKSNPRVMEVPFSSARKMMLTVNTINDGAMCEGGINIEPGSKMLTVCKGAPNFILKACSQYLQQDGTMADLTSEKSAEILGIVDEFSSLALRVLAIGCTFMKELPYDPDDDEITTDVKFSKCREGLQLLGLVASIDPERAGVPEAVVTARGASIRVVMITGDYLKTAIAIAHNCNILQDGDDDSKDAVDCGDLRPGDGAYLSNDEIDRMTYRVKVFARAQPEDKLEIVKSLQRQDFVSAMTGDGVNDAPALKRADIGVAMGIQGTEVAKGAADMILQDDNFATIVTAVEKGRIIYSGIQKFVAFIMSVHIAEVIQIFICVVARLPIMRTPLQILFLILVTDLPPSIALGVEPGEPGILNQKPRPKSEPIILSWMWLSITVNGMILSAVIIGVYLVSLDHYMNVLGEIGTHGTVGFFNTDITAFKSSMQGAANLANLESFQALVHFTNDENGLSLPTDPLEFIDKQLSKAQTVAFISLVYSENIRAYISRSFNKPVWTKLCANVAMQKAIAVAQCALYIAVFVPGLSTDILGLDGVSIGFWGWGVSLLGPILCLVLCEVYKVITDIQIRNYQKTLDEQEKAGRAQAQQKLTVNAILESNKVLQEQVRSANEKVDNLERTISGDN